MMEFKRFKNCPFVKKGIFLAMLGSFILAIFITRNSTAETTLLSEYPSIAPAAAVEVNHSVSSHPIMNQFFTEQTLSVTNEGDGFLPGTLRTVLIQAAGIRKNNPFTLVKIIFDSNVRTARIVKGPLRIEGGLIQIDCASKVSIDGTLFDTRYLDEKESAAGILIHSSGNTLRNCKIYGFPGKTVLIAGNRNQIRENVIGISSNTKAANPYAALATNVDEIKAASTTGLYLEDNASENMIESNNILGHKSEGVAFSAQAGSGNRIVGNAFSENGVKGIQSSDNQNRSFKPVIKSIAKDADGYILTLSLADPGDVEIYLAANSGREGKMPITPPMPMNRGDSVISLKNKGFVQSLTRLTVLITSPGRNTSEFSDSVVIPMDAPRPELMPQVPVLPPADTSNPNIPTEGAPVMSSQTGTSNISQTPVTAPAIDPFLNATTLPPPPVPQVIEAPRTGSALKSSSSDSVRMETTFQIGNGP